MKRLFKEVFIFFILLTILALVMHSQLREGDIAYFNQLSNNNPYHPFLYTLVVYIPIGILRLIIHFISNFFELAKKKK